MKPYYRCPQSGFTLLEVGIVLIIIAALAGSLIRPFGARLVERQRAESLQQLQTVRQALLGFAAARHRLPCPAGDDSGGLENCELVDGYVPAVTLGVAGRFADNSLLLDSWGNPLRYRVSGTDSDDDGMADFTSAQGMQRVGMQFLRPELRVCAAATCQRERANQVVAVLYSTGLPGLRPDSPDEMENLDGDARFVSRDLDISGDDQFDDILIWLSENVLYSKMIQAGVLP